MTQSTTISIDRRRRGSEIPSIPMWYRALMTWIQFLSTLNWSFPPFPKLKSARIPIPTTSVASEAISAVTLMACSWARGMNSTAARPASGMNTASVSAHSSNQCMASRYIASEDIRKEEGKAQECDSAEEQERIPLHLPGLDATHLVAGDAGLVGQPVDTAVDDALIDDVVGETRGDGGAAGDPVHDAVDDILIDPI